jgi:hypothetical protein
VKETVNAKQFDKIPKRSFIVIAIILLITTLASAALNVEASGIKENSNATLIKDSTTSVKAFMSIYQVLMSPRCMNCHPAGNSPLQGDDNHIHAMNPNRGADGKGLYAMKCSNCHQEENSSGLHTPPGSPNWHLPPSNMKMIFEGKTAYELAKQISNPLLNGNKDMKALLAHADDALVKWAWQPGEGRTLPPVTYIEFRKAWTTWLQTGAYAPKM